VILELVQEHGDEVTNFVQDPQSLLEPEMTIRIMYSRGNVWEFTEVTAILIRSRRGF